MKIVNHFLGTTTNSSSFHCKLFFFHCSPAPFVGGTLRWDWKTHFLSTILKEIDHFGGPVFLLKRSSLGTSDIQDCCYPKGITYLTIIHEGDPIPCKTTYIEYRSPVKIFIIFFRMPPNSIGLHCKIVFFHSSTTPVVGGTPRWAWKTHFLKQYEKKLIISEDLFLVETF